MWPHASQVSHDFPYNMQHATHCLFEWQTPVGSSEAAVCWFCLSILLHKDINKMVCTAVFNKTIHKKAFPMKISIFTVEVCALDLALNLISENKHYKFNIFSDSLSVLTSLRNKKLENPLIVKLLSRLDSMSSHKEIIICWIQSHIKVRGNERIDLAAKSALDLSPDNISIPYTDLKPQITKFFLTKWQQCWNDNINIKLFQIKATLGEWKPAFRKSRKEQVIISWLQIDHTSLTHSFILKQGQSTWCLDMLDTLHH